MSRWPLLVALSLASCAQPPSREPGGHGAHELEGRLVAPCCWVQTLDIHESPLATELRHEIDQRLQRGEQPGAIEDDLAARYSERIRAVPKGQDTRRLIPLAVGAAMVATLLGLLAVLRRWLHRERDAMAATPGKAPAAIEDEYERRLDEELARLDEAQR